MSQRAWENWSASRYLALTRNRLLSIRRGDAREIVTSFEQITPEWLTRVLQRNGFLSRAHVLAIESPIHATFTSGFAQIEVTYSEKVGLAKRFFVKYLAKGEGGRIWAAPAKREATFYRMGKRLATPPPARVYDEQHSLNWSRAHLLLQDLTETHERWWDLDQARREPAFEFIVGSLAQFHAAWRQHSLLGTSFAPLPPAEQVANLPQEPHARREAFFVTMGEALSPEQRAFSEQMMLPDVIKNICSWTRPRDHLTLEHGQPNPGNWMFARPLTCPEAVLVDWQSYRVGIGAFDLAYLLVWFSNDGWNVVKERALLSLYYQKLCACGVKRYSTAQFELDYRWGVIHLWHVISKLGAMPNQKLLAHARLDATWRAIQEWDCLALLKENRARA